MRAGGRPRFHSPQSRPHRGPRSGIIAGIVPRLPPRPHQCGSFFQAPLNAGSCVESRGGASTDEASGASPSSQLPPTNCMSQRAVRKTLPVIHMRGAGEGTSARDKSLQGKQELSTPAMTQPATSLTVQTATSLMTQPATFLTYQEAGNHTSAPCFPVNLYSAASTQGPR